MTTPEHRALRTLHEMLIDTRGYESICQSREHPNIFLVNKDNKPEIIIYFNGAHKFNIDATKTMIQAMDASGVAHCILVYNSGITASAKKALSLVDKHRIELFCIRELQFNITKHRFFCRHERVRNHNELGQLKSSISKLPKILVSDPVVRFFDFKKGDVLRIYRHDGTIAYRQVR